MHVTSEQRLDDDRVRERTFTLGEIPGILWTPASASTPTPLLLLGHSPLGLTDDIVDRLILPGVDAAVPELRAALDALLALPEIGGPVGLSGGVISVGVRLAAVEPRIRAARLFAGSFVPRAMYAEARQVTIPLQVLLQWDDEGNDRQQALDLFDAFGSPEKALHANMGGHTGVPASEAEEGNRFFARHLK
jgi:hypothetical protein